MAPLLDDGDAAHIGRHLLQDSTTRGTTAVTYATFLDDPYNKAMYLVLPLMVFIYGGCGAIYCIAKLRRYTKRKRRERILQARPDSQNTVIAPFMIDTDDEDDDQFIRRKKKSGLDNPLVTYVGKKPRPLATPPMGEPPPYSPEPRVTYIDPGYEDYGPPPEIHVFQQPDSPEMRRSAPTSRAGIELQEKPTLDPFHMPRPKKKKRLVFIAI